MSTTVSRLRDALGASGIAALALFGAGLVFHFAVLKPLELRNAALEERAARETPRPQAAQPAGDRVGAVYEFLNRGEQPTDWLAKLHAIGTATGVRLKAASYRTAPAEGRIVRYEIVLPVAGSYVQIRDFLQRSSAEIPVMSVDQLTLRRENRDAPALQAELRLTLHMVRS